MFVRENASLGHRKPAKSLRSLVSIVPVPYWAFAALVFVGMLVVSTLLESNFWSKAVLAATLASAAPLVLVAIGESAPIILGNGNIDISVGPLMTIINVSLVLIYTHNILGSQSWLLVPIGLLCGLLVGVVNGLAIGWLRMPAIVVTFGMYLLFSGLATALFPVPGGTIPSWLASWTGSFGPLPAGIVFIVVGALIWVAFRKFWLSQGIYVYGADKRAAYTSGLNVTATIVSAYCVSGFYAGFAALLLTSLIGSGSGTVGVNYTLTAITAVALGGVSLFGGRGGLLGTVLGAFDLYLLENILTLAHASVFYEYVLYGGMLVIALAVSFGMQQLGSQQTWGMKK